MADQTAAQPADSSPDRGAFGADDTDQRILDLEFLMREIEHAFETYHSRSAEIRREPDTPESRESRALDLHDLLHYIEELNNDLFSLMRDWNERPAVEIPDRSVSRAVPEGLAIVVGHDARASGAVALVPPFPSDPRNMRAEYYWNRELAEMMIEVAKAQGIRADVFFRDDGGVPGAYRRVKNFNPQATLELHFNSATASARGTEVIHGGGTSTEWAQTLQDEMVRLYEREGRLDRKIKHYNVTGRGGASLNKVFPSAIIEPFFGSNSDDCVMAIERKAGLAKALVQAFAKHIGKAWVEEKPKPEAPKPDAPAVATAPGPTPAPAPEPAPGPNQAPAPTPAPSPVATAVSPTSGAPTGPKPDAPVAPSVPSTPVAAAPAASAPANVATTVAAMAAASATVAEAVGGPVTATPKPVQSDANLQKPDRFSDGFWELALRYPKLEIEFPHLRGITLAQWALECGYGTTDLAKKHLNFAGMKWREVMKPYSTPVSYEAHDGRTDYCKFATLDNFIKGYWARLDLVSAYEGWRDHTKSPEDFIGYIAETWAPKQNYEKKVVELYRRMKADGMIPFEGPGVA
jgi:hypothetical protein